MRIFIFKSEANRDLCAFAGDSDTRRLPTKFGPWHAVGVIRPEKEPPYNFSRDAIEQAIEEAREMRREAASRIVVPGTDGGMGGPPPGAGRIKL